VFECLYQAVTTLTTVGFGELLDGMDHMPSVRVFTTVLIIAGVGVVLYVVSTFTATIIEGDLQRALRKTRMRNRISKLEGHVVVCGAGTTGSHVVEELIAAGRPCVAIDLDQQALDRGALQWGEERFLYIAGDATDDTVLHAANIARASGVVASLPNDKDNLYLVVTTRLVNPSARIVARGGDVRMLDKLKKAGADTVVSPNFIGGMRMVSELMRPHVVRFIDEMLRDRAGNWRIEEVTIPAGSGLVGQSLQQADLRGIYDVAVLAVRDRDGRYSYNPGADFVLEELATLIILGRLEQVSALRTQS
jgi:voltage-gated potassium channel